MREVRPGAREFRQAEAAKSMAGVPCVRESVNRNLSDIIVSGYSAYHEGDGPHGRRWERMHTHTASVISADSTTELDELTPPLHRGQ